MHVCPLIVCVVYGCSPKDEANSIHNTCFLEHPSIQMLTFWPHDLFVIQVWIYMKVNYFECICIHLLGLHILDCVKGIGCIYNGPMSM